MFRRKKKTGPVSPRQKQSAQFAKKLAVLREEANKWVTAGESEISNRLTVDGLIGWLEGLKASNQIINFYEIEMDEENNSLSYKVELYKNTEEPICTVTTRGRSRGNDGIT